MSEDFSRKFANNAAATAIDYLTDSACAFPDAVALRDRSSSITYAELTRQADAFSKKLRDCADAERRRLLISSEKMIETAVAICGTMLAGWTVACIDRKQPQANIEHVIETIRPDLALCCADPAANASFEGAVSRHRIQRVACSDTTSRETPALNQIVSYADPETLYSIAFTSGTTGRPKAAATRHRTWLNVIDRYVRDFQFGPDEVIGLQSSFAYDAIMDMMSAFALGAPAVLIPDDLYDDGPAWAAFVRRTGVTSIMLVPAALRFTLMSFTPATRFPPMRRLIFTGDRITPYEMDLVRRYVPRSVQLTNLYATTEVFYALRGEIDRDAPKSTARLFPPTPDMDHRVVPEDNSPLADHALLFRGDCVFEGYLDDPDVITRPDAGDGYFDNGDYFRRTPDGGLILRGRKDRRIKWQGFRIEPAEIEGAAESHPDVIEARCEVDPAGRLVLTFDAPDRVSEEELRNFLRKGAHPDLAEHVVLAHNSLSANVRG